MISITRIGMLAIIGSGLVLCFLTVLRQTVAAQHAISIAATGWPMYQHDATHSGQSPFQGISSYPVEVWKTMLYGLAGESSSGISIGKDGSLYTSANGWLSAIDIQNHSTTSPTTEYGRLKSMVTSDGFTRQVSLVIRHLRLAPTEQYTHVRSIFHLLRLDPLEYIQRH